MERQCGSGPERTRAPGWKPTVKTHSREWSPPPETCYSQRECHAGLEIGVWKELTSIAGRSLASNGWLQSRSLLQWLNNGTGPAVRQGVERTILHYSLRIRPLLRQYTGTGGGSGGFGMLVLQHCFDNLDRCFPAVARQLAQRLKNQCKRPLPDLAFGRLGLRRRAAHPPSRPAHCQFAAEPRHRRRPGVPNSR